MFDLYETNKNDTVRYILGTNGKTKLFVVGLNPSTANLTEADTTITKVEKVAKKHGYDGFVMCNLYPLRSTDPKKLPKQADESILERNIDIIIKYLQDNKKPVLWAAWGVDIKTRPYMLEALELLYRRLSVLNCEWVHYGDLTKFNHPKHPSRLSYSWEFNKFDVVKYIKNNK